VNPSGQTVFVIRIPRDSSRSYTGFVFSTVDDSVSSTMLKAKRFPSGHTTPGPFP
jgi:hypothetical protein